MVPSIGIKWREFTLPMMPFDESDIGRQSPMFGSGGFTPGTPVSTPIYKRQKKRQRENKIKIK